jgi:signal transduction histidine kinase
MTFSPAELRSADIFEGLSDAELTWFAEHGARLAIPAGEHMFERGQPADYMFVVVRGVIEGYEEVGGQLLRVATTPAGQVTGMLPFSRMTHYPRYTVAAEDTEVLRVHKRDFPGMLEASHEMGQRLVAEMSDRVRGDVRLEQQHERMAALGRLSAGLAHELNNPAAAVRRAAAGLADELTGLTDRVSRLVQRDVNATHIGAMNRLRVMADARRETTLSALARAEREDELAAWLDDHGVSESWDVPGTLTDAGVTVEDLDAFAAAVPSALLVDALTWVACDLGAQRLVGEIASAAARISELVGSVKSYSHMDRSSEHRPTDVREGLDSTLMLLSHKLKAKNVRLGRTFEDQLPAVSGNAGELNQVWTNLIDNAVDALDEGGELRVAAHRREADVEVTVTDDGQGIPDDVRDRIFEPFFTTKPVGEGTGLGLDIAMRIVRTHGGSLTLESQSGQTVARVRLPVATA